MKVVPSPPVSAPKISFIHSNSVLSVKTLNGTYISNLSAGIFVKLEEGFFTLPKDISREGSVHVTHFLSNYIEMPSVKFIFKVYSPTQKCLLHSRCIISSIHREK